MITWGILSGQNLETKKGPVGIHAAKALMTVQSIDNFQRLKERLERPFNGRVIKLIYPGGSLRVVSTQCIATYDGDIKDFTGQSDQIHWRQAGSLTPGNHLIGGLGQGRSLITLSNVDNEAYTGEVYGGEVEADGCFVVNGILCLAELPTPNKPVEKPKEKVKVSVKVQKKKPAAPKAPAKSSSKKSKKAK